WTEPVFVSPHDSNVLYTAAQFVLKSEDQGRSWKRISGDLTRNDKSKQQPSGGPITLDITSVEYYDTVFTLAESPLMQGMLWAGSDDGLIHVTRDDGKSWQNVTPKDMPPWSTVSMIEPSPHDLKTAFAAIDRHRLDDLSPLIYKTHDGGASWQRIVTGIPQGSFVRAVREDPKKAGLLYAATELGVYVSFDDGGHWQALQLNLPVAPVHDLVVKDDDLVAATHGRSFWILDDLTPLRQIEMSAAVADVRLYRPEPAYRLHFPIDVNRRRPVGDNPPDGAVIDYFLKDKARPDEEITLEILDAQGKVLRRYSNHRKDKFEQPAEWPDREMPAELLPDAAGMNRFPWDLRVEDPVQIPGAFYSDEGPRGPVVSPGAYTVRLTTSHGTQSQPLQVVPDPRLSGSLTAADEAAHWDLVSKTAADIEALHRAVNQIRACRTELQKLQTDTHASEARSLGKSVSKLENEMAPVEEQLIQVNMKASEDNLRYPNRLDEQYDTFIATIDGDDFRPTQPQLEVFGQLHGRLQQQLSAWKALRDKDLSALNAKLQASGAAPVTVPEGAPGM
ncbi:MAG TPA: hypothetical protein VFB37_06750, partial [Steroidobacteraceae bacterium]|nr:hypothetical protein [Steroidobacteraceae bacterium]